MGRYMSHIVCYDKFHSFHYQYDKKVKTSKK